MKKTLWWAPLLVALGCSGAAGEDGSTCSVEQTSQDVATITCTDGTSFAIQGGSAGMGGVSCTVEERAGGERVVSCEDGTSATLAAGGQGPMGPVGASGPPGVISLVRTSGEPPGDACPYGGVRLESGSDVDGDGALGDEEVDPEQTVWTCDAPSLSWKEVHPGFSNSCAISSDGDAYCWGRTAFFSSSSSREELRPVLMERDVSSYSLGASHRCVIRGSGALACRGRNDKGQVGAEGSTAEWRDVGLDAVQVSAGGFHTCAVERSGWLSCWGDNERGQVGIGPPAVRAFRPERVLPDVVHVSAGQFHTCAVQRNGQAWCWGDIRFARTGPTRHLTPVMVLDDVLTVESNFGTSCGLRRNQELWCWGVNSDRAFVDVPETTLSPTLALEDVVAFDLSNDYGGEICGVKTSGELLCWGRNRFGLVGDGTQERRVQPVSILQGVMDVALDSSGCAILKSGAVSCWGRNYIGDGSAEFSLTPREVVF